jgi:hypothetical protein
VLRRSNGSARRAPVRGKPNAGIEAPIGSIFADGLEALNICAVFCRCT